MANEIEVHISEDGGTSLEIIHQVIFFYDITPMTTFDGVLIVPTPRSVIPVDILDLELVTEAEKVLMDEGKLYAQFNNVKALRSDTLTQVRDKALATYNDEKVEIRRKLQQRYAFTGRRIAVS